MLYNGNMKKANETKKIQISVIGGGASGLFLAKRLTDKGFSVRLYERGERLGKKLSATGNGQGNITNVEVCSAEYFSTPGYESFVSGLIAKYDDKLLFEEFAKMGVLLFYDERGRAYPAGRQASALTDALRFYLQEKGVDVRLSSQVLAVQKKNGRTALTVQTSEGTVEESADYVVFCTGGKAQKNFGTDGTAYAYIRGLGHNVTALYPSLVQLKTDVRYTKTLKGIRVADAGLSATYTKNGKSKNVVLRGDVIFTDYGVSGDAVFRISAFVADIAEEPNNVSLYIDFLPDFTEEQIMQAVLCKRDGLQSLPQSEWLGGIVNNQVGRAIMKRASEKGIEEAVRLVKAFPLSVTGTLGFDYAQVTKGGVPLNEVTEELQSKKADGVYFAGETLDVDGQCGGFNLQWAFSSACAVADAIAKREGQV